MTSNRWIQPNADGKHIDIVVDGRPIGVVLPPKGDEDGYVVTWTSDLSSVDMLPWTAGSRVCVDWVLAESPSGPETTPTDKCRACLRHGSYPHGPHCTTCTHGGGIVDAWVQMPFTELPDIDGNMVRVGDTVRAVGDLVTTKGCRKHHIADGTRMVIERFTSAGYLMTRRNGSVLPSCVRLVLPT